MSRIFLLSPAHCGGKRAQMLLREAAQFDLATRLRREGAPLGEVFAFLSGLYFRGKLAYAAKFAQPPTGWPGALVITTNRGLLPAETIVTHGELSALGAVSIDGSDPRYAEPLDRDAARLATEAGCEVVLLGSIATGKYVERFLPLLGERLRFPAEFVGRGDMSRGGLMLRAAESGEELSYVPVAGAIRHGARPPKLTPRRSRD